MGPCPLCTSQQWLLVSMLTLVSSANLPGCGALPFCCFRLSPHHQQLSLPWFTTQLSSSLAVSQFRLGAQGCVTDSVLRYYSVLPSTVWSLHSTLTRKPKDSSRSPLIPLPGEGFSGCVTSPFLQNPSGALICPFPSFLLTFLLSYMLPSCAVIFLIPLGAQGYSLVFSICFVRIVLKYS